MMLIAGVVFSPWGARVMTIRQKVIPASLQGRVMGTTLSVTMVAGPIGAWATGFLLGDLSAQRIFFGCGMATLAIGTLAFCWPSFRNLDTREQ